MKPSLPLHVCLTAAAIGVATTIVRFLSYVGFPNDHFLYLASAMQMLHGEWPSRDFVDPGTPLVYLLSAAAQLVITPPLLAENWLVSGAFGLAAALTLLVTYRLSGNLWIATGLAIAQVALFPRTYHYPKLLAYAAALLASFAYVDQPTRRRAGLLAGSVVVALLLRHDHGVYLGMAAIATAAIARPGWRGGAQRVVEVMAWGAVLSAPYLAYLQVTTGVTAHVAAGVAYSAAEAERTTLGFPTLDVHALATAESIRIALFYAYHALPLLALGSLLLHAQRARARVSRVDVARIVPLAILAVAINVSMLRDPLEARLPDVSVPAFALIAWLVPRAWRAERGRALARLAVVASAALGLVAVNVVGEPVKHLEQADLWDTPSRVFELVGARTTDIVTPLLPINFSSGVIEDVVPFLEYVRRCTAPDQRLFVAGEMPEIYVHADRPFAGGQPVLRLGFFDTVADQQRLVARLRAQPVAFAMVFPDSDARLYPIVLRELDARFQPLTAIAVRGREPVRVLVRRGMSARGVDQKSGWPCFR